MREEERTGGADLTEVKADFLQLLADYERTGRSVSPSPSATYAPKLFADMAGAGFSKARYKHAMDALFRERKIEIIEEGPPSRRRKRLSMVHPSSPDASAQEPLEVVGS